MPEVEHRVAQFMANQVGVRAVVVGVLLQSWDDDATAFDYRETGGTTTGSNIRKYQRVLVLAHGENFGFTWVFQACSRPVANQHAVPCHIG